MLAHAGDVGQHHPVVAVDEDLVEPRGHLPGVPPALQGVVAEDHQARDVVHPAPLPQVAQHRRQAVGRDLLVGVERAEPLRHVGVGGQEVAVPVVLGEVPVERPDVLPPADHLADVALDAVQRRPTLAVRLLGGVHGFERVEQAEVHRRRQGAVRHPRVGPQHRVLSGAEVGEPVLDEVLEPGQRLEPRHRRPARRVVADEAHEPVALPPVEVLPDLRVDVVLPRQPGLLETERAPLRRRLAVVVVEVPLPADRLVAVHEQAEAHPLPPVEVLHQQALATADPGREVLPGGREAAPLRHHLEAALPDEAVRCVRRRLHDRQRPVDPVVREPAQRLVVGVDLQEHRLLAELERPVAQPGQQQVRLGAVEPPATEHRP